MFRRTLFLLERIAPVGKSKQKFVLFLIDDTNISCLIVECLQPSFVSKCRHYTTNNSLLAEINMKMFHVLDDASARGHGNKATLTKILQLAQELRQSGEAFDNETYEHILSAYAKGGEDKTNMLYKQMTAQGVRPGRSFFHKSLQVNNFMRERKQNAVN
jgi:hypothetical protein